METYQHAAPASELRDSLVGESCWDSGEFFSGGCRGRLAMDPEDGLKSFTGNRLGQKVMVASGRN